MLAILDQEVPPTRPLFISYESFWNTIKTNSVLRADPTSGGDARLRSAGVPRAANLHAPGLQAMALRVINAWPSTV